MHEQARTVRAPSGQRSGPAEVFCLARAVLGVTYLGRALAGQGAGDRRSGLSRGVLAILGVRHLAQALASVRPTPAVLLLGAEADGAHGASMAAAALMPRPWRRAALLDGLLAGALAVTGVAIARGEERAGRSPGSVQARGSLLALRDRGAALAARCLLPGWRRS